MRGIGQEDADAFDDDRSPWHAFMMAAVQEGGGEQEWFERIGDAGVMAEIKQPVDVVLHVPAVLSEEAVAEVFEGLAAGSRPRPFAIQEMILELQQADRAVAGSEGRDSRSCSAVDSANIAASSGPRLPQCMSSTGPFRQTSMTRPTAIALTTAS
jgi:hypothetical protein